MHAELERQIAERKERQAWDGHAIAALELLPDLPDYKQILCWPYYDYYGITGVATDRLYCRINIDVDRADEVAAAIRRSIGIRKSIKRLNESTGRIEHFLHVPPDILYVVCGTSVRCEVEPYDEEIFEPAKPATTRTLRRFRLKDPSKCLGLADTSKDTGE